MADSQKIRFDRSSTTVGRGAIAGQTVPITVDDKKLDEGLDRAAKKVQAFGQTVRNIGLGASIGAGALTAALTAMGAAAADMGQQILIASQKTGIGAQAMSELRYAATQTGTDLETLEHALGRMSRFLVEAAEGSSTAKMAMVQLRTSIADLQSMNPEQRFNKLADALSKVGDENLRQALAIQVFGRNGRAILPMLQEGAAGLEKWRQRARDLNLSQTAEDVQKLASFKNSLQDMGAVLERVGVAIGTAVMPALKKKADLIAKIGSKVVEWIDHNRQVIITIFNVAKGVTAAGIAITILGGAISALGAAKNSMGLGDLVAVISAMISPIGLLTTAVVGLGAYLVYTSKIGGAAMKYLGEVFAHVKEDAAASIKGITDALSGGQWALAAKIAQLTLRIEAERGIAAISDAWVYGMEPMKEAWQNLLTSVANATAPFITYIEGVWVKVSDATKSILSKMLANVELSFVTMWENVKFNTIKTFSDMLNDMQDSLNGFVASVWNAIANIVNSLATLKTVYVAMAFPNWAFSAPPDPLDADNVPGGPIARAPNRITGERQKTELEKSLAAKVGPGGPGGASIADTIKAKLAETQPLIDALVKKLNAALKGIDNGLTNAGPEAREKIEKMKKELQEMLDAAAAANKAIADRPENKLPQAGVIPAVGGHAAGTFNASAVFGLASHGAQLVQNTKQTVVELINLRQVLKDASTINANAPALIFQ